MLRRYCFDEKDSGGLQSVRGSGANQFDSRAPVAVIGRHR